jgi:hypothetical protein
MQAWEPSMARDQCFRAPPLDKRNHLDGTCGLLQPPYNPFPRSRFGVLSTSVNLLYTINHSNRA